jgi:hypothetical protein
VPPKYYIKYGRILWKLVVDGDYSGQEYSFFGKPNKSVCLVDLIETFWPVRKCLKTKHNCYMYTPRRYFGKRVLFTKKSSCMYFCNRSTLNSDKTLYKIFYSKVFRLVSEKMQFTITTSEQNYRFPSNPAKVVFWVSSTESSFKTKMCHQKFTSNMV